MDLTKEQKIFQTIVQKAWEDATFYNLELSDEELEFVRGGFLLAAIGSGLAVWAISRMIESAYNDTK